MIHDTDRRWWFGASDSKMVMTPNHQSNSWQSWWRVKCGVEEQEFKGNKYTDAGTRYEHPILECFNKDMNKDRQIIIEDLRLRVNYDGDFDGNIFEVKTHKAGNEFEITPYIYAQVQTQMYAWKETRDDFKHLYILSYALTEDDYANQEPTVDDIDFDRIKVHKVKYSKGHIKRYLKALEPLAKDLKEIAEVKE